MYLNLKYYQDDWANMAIDVRLTHRFNLLYPNHSPPWTVTSTHSKCNRTENSKVHSPQIDPWFQDRSSIRAEEHLIGAQTITQRVACCYTQYRPSIWNTSFETGNKSTKHTILLWIVAVQQLVSNVTTFFMDTIPQLVARLRHLPIPTKHTH